MSVLDRMLMLVFFMVFFCHHIESLLVLKDVVTRVLAHELKLDETPVSKVMSRNPVFVLSDTFAVEALQKMVLGFNVR